MSSMSTANIVTLIAVVISDLAVRSPPASRERSTNTMIRTLIMFKLLSSYKRGDEC